MTCPRCRGARLRSPEEPGGYWDCARCHGRLVEIRALNAYIRAQAVSWLREMAATASPLIHTRCPRCLKYMSPIRLEQQYGGSQIDVCNACACVWFDRGELERTVIGPDPREDGGPLIEGASWSDSPTQIVLGLLHMPILEPKGSLFEIGNATKWIALSVGIISLLCFLDLRPIVDGGGFIPAIALSGEYYRWITAFFIHGNLAHLIGNLYFFVMFSKRVEEELGADRMIALLLLTVIGGNMAVLLGTPDSTIPCIGASDGIAGVLGFYAVKFPRTKVSLMTTLWLKPTWIHIPAAPLMLVFFLMDAVAVPAQIAGTDIGTSYLSHVGGMLVGAALGFVWSKEEA